MKRYHSISGLRKIDADLHVAIGVFDGVHLGHQEVIGAAVGQAEKDGGTPMVITFDPHPAMVLSPSDAPRVLTATGHKLSLIEKAGVREVLVISFDREFSETEPESFIRELCGSARNLASINVGEGWRFGRGGTGNLELLERLSGPCGFRVTGVPTRRIDGMKVSSTRIREAVGAGDLEVARRLLGRDYTVLGTVVTGRKLGRELGFPTANLSVHSEQLPPTGVYAVDVDWQGRRFGGVGNLGYRPSVEDGALKRRLEVHLFGLEEDIYGEDLEVTFVDFLRPETKFAGAGELRDQIEKDVAAAEAILEEAGRKG
jgi:riboflavin kinase/FMN adenylyltransferase